MTHSHTKSTHPEPGLWGRLQAGSIERLHIRLESLLVLLILCVTNLPAEAARAEKSLADSKPNIVLVITDDQGYAPIGRHGHPWIATPHLDALYDTSTRLTRFLVSPTCSPT
ncbi:MAG: hypothetical protein ABGW90_06240, partial [Martelella sp.]